MTLDVEHPNKNVFNDLAKTQMENMKDEAN